MGGFLKTAFWWAVKGATIGLIAAVWWQIFMDPLFFFPIHDPNNTVVQAFVLFMNDWFGWIPDLVGFTGDSGFLHSDFAQGILEPYMELEGATVDTASYVAEDAVEVVEDNLNQALGLGY